MVQGHPSGGSIRIKKGGSYYACRSTPLASKASYRDPGVYWNPRHEMESLNLRKRRIRANKTALGLNKSQTSKANLIWDFQTRSAPANIQNLLGEALRIAEGGRKKRSDAGKKRGPRMNKDGSGPVRKVPRPPRRPFIGPRVVPGSTAASRRRANRRSLVSSSAGSAPSSGSGLGGIPPGFGHLPPPGITIPPLDLSASSLRRPTPRPSQRAPLSSRRPAMAVDPFRILGPAPVRRSRRLQAVEAGAGKKAQGVAVYQRQQGERSSRVNRGRSLK